MSQKVNVDACLQALSGWHLADLWVCLSAHELWELGAMLADHADGVPTAAHQYPDAEQRLGFWAENCGLDPATGERAAVEPDPATGETEAFFLAKDGARMIVRELQTPVRREGKKA
ncbi:hypothetical protein THIX_61007 [Thiomonas sp. X19]|uniref:hypothetical protein n=1 Tax=Thiomonas sp. X19 TaxID=1050370 RepID=UPI000B654AEC|nr:hypothetical protein [Thiomonas sp. X19]SCC94949.1 hypothetical protein THIX_61007 [Thiomonas sp. X19]